MAAATMNVDSTYNNDVIVNLFVQKVVLCVHASETKLTVNCCTIAED